MKNIFLSIIGLAFVVSIAVRAEEVQPGCLHESEAIAVKEEFNGKTYIRIKFCESTLKDNKIVLLPNRCFKQDELNKFLDSIKEPAHINKIMWTDHLPTLGFKNPKDLEMKLVDFKKEQGENAEICMSGEIMTPSTEKRIRSSSDYIAEYFNQKFRKDPMSLNGDAIPIRSNTDGTVNKTQ